MKTLKLSSPMRSDRKLGKRKSRKVDLSPVTEPHTVGADSQRAANPEHGGTPKKTATVAQIKKALRENYPVLAEGKPLAGGCKKEILKDRPESWARIATEEALRDLTCRLKYLRAVAEPNARLYHLDGSDAGEVPENHRQFMLERIAERANKKPPTVKPEVDKTNNTFNAADNLRQQAKQITNGDRKSKSP